jgi:hypothetical protein
MAKAATTSVKLKYNYIKSNFFRVIYAEGAYGGINPRGNINFSFYNERNAIPQLTELDVESNEAGLVVSSGVEKPTQARDGIVRELEVEVSMSLDTAIAFHDWLGARIKILAEMKRPT